MMNWDNYIKENTRKPEHLSDCQLVTAINAYYHLTRNIIKQDSDEYKELIDITGCNYGACINVQKAWKKLGICEDKRFKYYDLKNYLSDNIFLEVSIWYKRYGFHSTSVVDYCSKTKALRIVNLKYLTSTDGWIFIEDLQSYLIENPDKSLPRWHFRTYKLKE